MKPLKILIVDDHPVVRAGLIAMFADSTDFEVIGAAENGLEACKIFGDSLPSIVLIDLSLPDVDGIELISMLKKIGGPTRYVVLTTRTGGDDINRSLHAGAHAYLFKDTAGSELLIALKMVAQGGRYIPPNVGRKAEELPIALEITSRERQVMLCLAKGFSNEKIARHLNIALETVKSHIKNILEKLGLESRTEIISLCLKTGLVHVDNL
jgi:two-component system NarL family response regulator